MFELGERVRIRDRLWSISGVRDHGGVYTVEVVGIGDENRSSRHTFIYPLEEVERVPSAGLRWEIGQPKLWKALHDTYLLSMAYGSGYLVSLNRARINMEDYQLAAVLQAFRLPRQRILLADDVGLGKTIEAALILLELMARRRGDKVLVVTPASLSEQWQDELLYRLGLSFEIFDSAFLKKFISMLPRGANPWEYCNRIITSIDYVKREDVKRALRNVKWDVVIVDEAHYLCESSSGKKVVRTDRSRFGEFISERTDCLLLLSATPHDGYSHSFFSLLRLLDPFLCVRAEDLTRKRVGDLVVRRLKGEITNPDGSPKFQKRNVRTIPLTFSNEIERSLYREVCKYADGVYKEARKRAETITVGFAMAILKRRLISSPEALRISLRHRRENPSVAPVDPYSHRGLVADYIDGVPLSESQSERVQKVLLSSYIPEKVDFEKTNLSKLIELSERVTPEVDSKAKALLGFLKDFFGERPDEKVIIFTEFRDTQNYLKDYLSQRGFENAISLLYGGMSKTRRKEAKEAFQRPETRILLATDAASEGLNFQEDSCTVVHYELPWNPNRLEQRNGRVDRYGQRKTVTVYNLHLTDTYESEVLERLKQKIERIHKEFGSTSDILGSFARFKVDDLLMGSGGLKEDLPDVEERIRKSDEVLEEMISQGQSVLDEWQTRSYIRVSPFGQTEKEAVKESLKNSESLLPDFNELESLTKLVVEGEGGLIRSAGEPKVYKIVVPRRLQGQDVEPTYPRATFDRETAVANRDIVFLTASHPLIRSVLHFVRSCVYEGRRGYRMSYKVVEAGVDPGVLFTYVARFMDGKGGLLCESLIPVFVSLDGSPSWSESSDFSLLKCSGKPLNVPSELLEKEYRPRWEALLKLAWGVAERRRDQLFKRIQRWHEGYCDRVLDDIKNWRNASHKIIVSKYGKGVQTTLGHTITLHRMQYEIRMMNQKADKREKEVREVRSLNSDKLDELGALLIVPEDSLQMEAA